MANRQPIGLSTAEIYQSKKEEVLTKFRKDFIEGNYLYDVRVHAVVEMLIRGADPYEIIQQLLIQNKELSDKLITAYHKIHNT